MGAVRRGIVPLCAAGLGLLTACHSWKPIDVPRPPAPVSTLRDPVRLQLRNGQVRELVNVVIATDSLFGTSNDPARIRSAYHLTEVQSLEVLRDDPARTVGLVVLLAILGSRAGLSGS